jgi:CheY-like chemotaxis protein
MIRILIVEDDRNKLSVIIGSLLKSGVKIDQISNSYSVKSAYDKLKLTLFDIVILDMNLPLRDDGASKNDSGVQLLKKFETDELLTPKSIIGITSYVDLKKKYQSVFESFDFNLYSYDDSSKWEVSVKNKINWIQKEKNNERRYTAKKIVITVHGIRTAGIWQNKLRDSISSDHEEIVTKSFKAPHLSVLRLIIPMLRAAVVESFSNQVDELFRQYPEGDFYFFSHSFGTFMLASKLSNLDPINAPKINSVLLAGSVLNRSFDWSVIKNKLNIKHIINDCGRKDVPLLLSEIFAPGMGMAGRRGFYSFEDGIVNNRFFNGGHSFFEESKDFYNDYWLPILKDEEPIIPLFDDTSRLSGFIEGFIDSIKLYFWVSIICVLIYLVSTS